jgi:hypothetical protein
MTIIIITGHEILLSLHKKKIMTKEKITAMGDEHINWLNALEFYKQELGILRERLTEIAGKNTGKEASAEVEHFENQIKVQLENIDLLHHEINENLVKSAAQAHENKAGYISTDLVEIHNKQKEKFDTTEKVIKDLRHDFNRFATQWM